MSSSKSTNWLKFFREAGIPPSDATTYALIFNDNRIREDMLMDLTKEYLKDMNISVMGDVIAILKHAKSVTGHYARKNIPSLRPEKLGGDFVPTPFTKRSTPATRMLEHYVRKESPPRQNRLKRSLDDSTSSSSKRSVFSRLGDNAVSSTSDFPKTLRNGDKGYGHMRSDYLDGNSDASPLEYQGILKYSSKDGNDKISASKSKVTTMSADTTTGIKSRLGLKAQSKVYQSEGIFAREFSKIFGQVDKKRPEPRVERNTSPIIRKRKTSESSIEMPFAKNTLKTFLITKRVTPTKEQQKPNSIYISDESNSSDQLTVSDSDVSMKGSEYSSSDRGKEINIKPKDKKKKNKNKKKKNKKKKKYSSSEDSDDSDSSRLDGNSTEEELPTPRLFPITINNEPKKPRKKLIRRIVKNKKTGEVISVEEECAYE